MSELRPEEVFTNIEPGEKLHYLERESEEWYKRVLIVDVLVIASTCYRVGIFNWQPSETSFYTFPGDLLGIVIFSALSIIILLHWLIPSYSNLLKSGVGVTDRHLYYKNLKDRSTERKIPIKEITQFDHWFHIPYFEKEWNFKITLKNGEVIRLLHLENHPHFIDKLQTMIDNQRSNNQSETR